VNESRLLPLKTVSKVGDYPKVNVALANLRVMNEQINKWHIERLIQLQLS